MHGATCSVKLFCLKRSEVGGTSVPYGATQCESTLQLAIWSISKPQDLPCCTDWIEAGSGQPPVAELYSQC